MTTMKIGQRELEVPAFSGYKGFYVGEIISRLGDELPRWQMDMAAFRSEYGERNKMRITKEISDARGYGLTEAAFANKPYIEVPGVPTPIEEILSVLPKAFPVARDEITRMVALVVIPDRELEELDEAGTVDEELHKRGKRLLHEGDLEQIAELIGYGVGEVRGKLGGLASNVFGSWSQDSPQPSQEETSGQSSPAEQGDTRRTDLSLAKPDPETLPNQPSSTDSPADTAGHAPTPSTAAAGSRSSSSMS